MKKIVILLICVVLIACLAFVIFKDKFSNVISNENTWPSISYLSDAEKYTGAGKITHTNNWDDNSFSIYINEATEKSVSEYCAKLINAGWMLVVGPINNADNTGWGYAKGDATCSIRLYNSTQTEERSSGNYSFNLYIGFENDGVILPSDKNVLACPIVSISSSGLASWSAIANASGYKYKINDGEEQVTQNTSVQLQNGQSIQVKAVGDETNFTDSIYSSVQTYTKNNPNPTEISVNDFDYQLGSHYYISSCWDVIGYDYNDEEYVYQEYRKIALINGIYFIETYDFNYEKSNEQGNFAQAFYVPNGSDYSLYCRYDTDSEFELISLITSNSEFSIALSIAFNETGITRAKTYLTVDTIQNVTVGTTSTHYTGRTVKKYTYGTPGTPIYDFYIDTQTKACLKFDDYVNDGHINLSIFSTSGNAWGINGLPDCPDEVNIESTTSSRPMISIIQIKLINWKIIPKYKQL